MRLSSDPAARRRLGLLAGAALLALAAGIAVGGGDGGSPGEPKRASPAAAARVAVDRLSLREQVGQLTISSFPGSRPPPYVRRRLR